MARFIESEGMVQVSEYEFIEAQLMSESLTKPSLILVCRSLALLFVDAFSFYLPDSPLEFGCQDVSRQEEQCLFVATSIDDLLQEPGILCPKLGFEIITHGNG